MDYRMKNIGATVSLYNIVNKLDSSLKEDFPTQLCDIECLFKCESESSCDYFKDSRCMYFGYTGKECSVAVCPLGEIVEEELKTLAQTRCKFLPISMLPLKKIEGDK